MAEFSLFYDIPFNGVVTFPSTAIVLSGKIGSVAPSIEINVTALVYNSLLGSVIQNVDVSEVLPPYSVNLFANLTAEAVNGALISDVVNGLDGLYVTWEPYYQITSDDATGLESFDTSFAGNTVDIPLTYEGDLSEAVTVGFSNIGNLTSGSVMEVYGSIKFYFQSSLGGAPQLLLTSNSSNPLITVQIL